MISVRVVDLTVKRFKNNFFKLNTRTFVVTSSPRTSARTLTNNTELGLVLLLEYLNRYQITQDILRILISGEPVDSSPAVTLPAWNACWNHCWNADDCCAVDANMQTDLKIDNDETATQPRMLHGHVHGPCGINL